VKFSIVVGSALGTGYGRIYKNGVAFGTEQTTNSTSFVIKTEDLSVTQGDLIQIYYKITGAATTVNVKNIAICSDGYGALYQ
jgi:hypothetical protein